MVTLAAHHLIVAGCFPNCTTPASPDGTTGGGAFSSNAILGFIVILVVLRIFLGVKGKGGGK
jgi:hypothetical protein